MLVGQFKSVALESLLEMLSRLKGGDDKIAKPLWHVIRSGITLPSAFEPDDNSTSVLRFSVKGSCGYLCRWTGDILDVEVHAYFAYTEFGTAVRIDSNRLLYNVFDTRFEHLTCVPVVREGDRVIVNDKRLSILAWG